MSWLTKAKIQQAGDDEKILTPDGLEILVGSPQDQVLLYQRLFSNWGLKTRSEQIAWSNKSKVDQASWSLKTKIQQ